MRKTAVLFAAILFLAGALRAASIEEPLVRVGILQNVVSCNISSGEGYRAQECSSKKTIEFAPLNDYLVKGDGSAISINDIELSSPVRFIPMNEDDYLRVGGKRYHGTILVICRGGRLTVVNEITMEDYICGILSREASPDWPLESLKSQAVISRTYALRNLNKHDKEGFDLCNQTHCQVYGGVESENERTTPAVESTRGEVLLYDGEPANTLFHASCAGHLENPVNVWSLDQPCPRYLAGRADRFCGTNPHSSWKNRISADQIKAKLRKAGYAIGDIQNIKMSGRSGSDRVKLLKIKHSKGTLSLSAAKFRLIVDSWLVKSTVLTGLSRRGNSFEFRGKGWGHGVGLCQWGAKVMGEKGYTYEKILDYYYPGTKLEQYWE
jgi:stage II sporulation protein D